MSKPRDSITGSKTPEIGVSPETDSGATQSQSGALKTEKKSLSLDQSKSFRSSQAVEKSLTFTETTSIQSQSLQNKEKESSEESKKFSTVGSNQAPCLSLRAITHSLPVKKSMPLNSQVISSQKDSTKPEAGSTLSTFWPLR